MDTHTLATDLIRATVSQQGAELVSLCDRNGRELVWQAGSAWPRHAPILFPIVGQLNGGRFRHGGKDYELPRHGFARDRRFDWVDSGPDRCRLTLTDDEATRSIYPFPFRLDVSYLVEGERLTIGFTITNPGAEALPVSLGTHPAFRWPLVDGTPKEAHSLIFDREEPAPVRRADTGLILPDGEPSPVEGRTLRLSKDLFHRDALILDEVRSNSLRYTAPGCPTIEVGWRGFSQLGIWSKADGDFLCIEPWQGYADLEGFTGPFVDKPGLMHIPPGGSRDFTLSIAVF